MPIFLVFNLFQVVPVYIGGNCVRVYNTADGISCHSDVLFGSQKSRSLSSITEHDYHHSLHVVPGLMKQFVNLQLCHFRPSSAR